MQAGAQVLLVVAGPGHVAVGAQQRRGRAQAGVGVGDAVDPAGPALRRQAAGPVQQQPAAAAHPLVQPALLQRQVPQPPPQQRVPPAEVVADGDRGDLLGQAAADLRQVHQLGQQPPHRLRPRLGGHQLHLRAGVVQDVGGDRAPFGLVGVQQPGGRPAGDAGGQFPAEVERVLDPEVESLSPGGRVDVRRVPGQQHPPGPVALGEAGGVAEPRQPARGVHAEVGAGDRPQPPPELLQGRGDGAVLGDALGGHDDAVGAVGGGGPDAEPLLGLADPLDDGGDRGGVLGHLHLAEQRLDPGGLAGEPDAEQLADGAAAAVAADQVARAQPRAPGQFGDHAVVVLGEAGQLGAAADLGAERGGVLGQQPLGGGLRDAEDVPVGGVEPARRRLGDGGEEAAEGVAGPGGEEPVQQAPLVHDLDAAHVQAQRADDPVRLGLLFQHERADAVQPQLGGEHQPGRAGADDDDVEHEPPISSDASDSSDSSDRGCGRRRPRRGRGVSASAPGTHAENARAGDLRRAFPQFTAPPGNCAP